MAYVTTDLSQPSHFIVEKTEAQRSLVICLKSQKETYERGFVLYAHIRLSFLSFFNA